MLFLTEYYVLLMPYVFFAFVPNFIFKLYSQQYIQGSVGPVCSSTNGRYN